MEFEFRGHPCAYCRQEVLGEPTSCRRCHAVYHSDCWTANRSRCAVYGCEPASPPPAPTAPPGREVWTAPRSSFPWAVLVVVLVPVVRLLSEANWKPPAVPAPKAVDSEQIRLLRRSFSEPPPAVTPATEEGWAGLKALADALRDSAAPKVEKVWRQERIPETAAGREELRREISSAASVLAHARELYQRCAAFREDAFLRERIDGLSGTIARLEWLKSTLDRHPEGR